MMRNRSGFTLIELIIVIVIIGILASIAAPMMSGMKKKAIVTEIVTTLGVIRGAEREYFVEHGFYTPNIDSDLNLPHLGGVYFSRLCYTGFSPSIGWRGGDPRSIMLTCHPGSSQGRPKSADAVAIFGQSLSIGGNAKSYISMDENGKIYSDFSDLGYPSVDYTLGTFTLPPSNSPYD